METREHRHLDRLDKPGGRRRSLSRRHAPRKLEKKKIASKQINTLLQFAIVNRRDRPGLARRQARTAWRMATRFNVKLRERRSLFCHYCKEFIVPPYDARFRLSTKRRGLSITCLICGKTYRKILG